ncbi:MAG TPA: FimV/HubP family polar landmark protein [Burkholderiales bacterium]|nr:FimV/HubP family polar landmark protein [Burkholderiales bacterium]
MSALGQPLNAEIELLSVQKGEGVAAKLASVETYQQANLQYNPSLVGTRVTVEKRANGQLYLKATTPRAINEPFVELVVELNSEHGRVTRQYTILLDPPGYGRGTAEVPPPAVAASTPRPAVVAPEETAAAAPVPTPAEPPAAETEVTAEAAPAAPVRSTPIQGAPAAARQPSRAASDDASTASSAANQYGPIKPGENLFRIASRVKPEGATLEQTLLGLYRSNPDAFIKKNMNLVKSGKILRIPEPSELAALPQREAAHELHVQIADFNAMRAKLADGAGVAREEGSVTSGRIGARIDDAGAAAPRDTVRLSKGEPPTGKAARSGNTADRVRALEEEAVAREKALAEAHERITQLEKTIKDMQRLTELKSSGAAATQQQSTAKAGPVQQPAAISKGGIPTAAVIASTPAAEATQAAGPEPAKSAPSPAVKSAASDAPKTADADSANAPAPEAKAPAVAPASKAKTDAPAAPSEDLLETVMNEPLYLAAGGAAVLLGGLGVMMARRRRKSDDDPKEDKIDRKIGPKLTPATAAAAAGAREASALANERTVPRASFRDENAAEPASANLTTARHSSSEEDDARFDAQRNSPGRDTVFAEQVSEDMAHHDEHTESVAMADPELPAARESHEQEHSADFDADVTMQPGAHAEGKTFETIGTDFGLDLPTEQPSAAHSMFASEHHADENAPEVNVNQFGLDAPTMQPEPALAAESAAGHVMDFNLGTLPALDTPGGTMAAERTASESVEEFKLDDLDLNFGAPPAGGGQVKDDHWYDVQQKFDLAKAYEEMGDKDGAREILQEVVREGDSEQQGQASKLLGSLS